VCTGGGTLDFVISRGQRRNVTKGQQAIALAIRYSKAKRGGARQKGASPETGLGFSKQRLSDARLILAHSRELALAVRDGTGTMESINGSQFLDLERGLTQRPGRVRVLGRCGFISARAPTSRP
jgi:hypothetical protein